MFHVNDFIPFLPNSIESNLTILPRKQTKRGWDITKFHKSKGEH